MVVGYPGDETIVVENLDCTGFKYDCDQVSAKGHGNMEGCYYKMVAAGREAGYWYAIYAKEALPRVEA